MMTIVADIMFALLLISMALLIIYPLYLVIIDSYYFKVRYCGISGHCHTEYFSVRAASLKRAYKKLVIMQMNRVWLTNILIIFH